MLPKYLFMLFVRDFSFSSTILILAMRCFHYQRLSETEFLFGFCTTIGFLGFQYPAHAQWFVIYNRCRTVGLGIAKLFRQEFNELLSFVPMASWQKDMRLDGKGEKNYICFLTVSHMPFISMNTKLCQQLDNTYAHTHWNTLWVLLLSLFCGCQPDEIPNITIISFVFPLLLGRSEKKYDTNIIVIRFYCLYRVLISITHCFELCPWYNNFGI